MMKKAARNCGFLFLVCLSVYFCLQEIIKVIVMSEKELKALLDQKVKLYNQVDFITYDPISVPHQFLKKEDIEIIGFITSLISWGSRILIIRTCKQIAILMDYSPFDFLTNRSVSEFRKFENFYYRTFKSDDIIFLLNALRNIYLHKGGFETIANTAFSRSFSIMDVISDIRNILLETPHVKRSEKHFPNPLKGSAAKRINMFLRWMVRKDDKGVDFGIWNKIPNNALMCPLDVHSGRVARKLGLLTRKQNDWKSVVELTQRLSCFDPDDPVKYDFALFGLGAFESY